MQMLQKYHIDCYVGVQLMCTLKWKENGRKGYHPDKYAKFIGNFNTLERRYLQPIQEKFERELDNVDFWELLNEYATLVPKEYRVETWQKCKEIINSFSPVERMDKKILEAIEIKMGITEGIWQ